MADVGEINGSGLAPYNGRQGCLISQPSPSNGLNLDLPLILEHMQSMLAIALRGSDVSRKNPQSFATLSLGARCMVCLLLSVRSSWLSGQ